MSVSCHHLHVLSTVPGQERCNAGWHNLLHPLCSICPNLSAGVRPLCKEVFCPAWAVKNSLHSSLFAQIVISGYCTIRYLQNGFSGSVFCSAWSLPMAWIGSKQISKFCLHTQYTITQKSKSKSKTLGVLQTCILFLFLIHSGGKDFQFACFNHQKLYCGKLFSSSLMELMFW